MSLPPAGPSKHSLTVNNRATTVSLEPLFWEAVRTIAFAQRMSPSAWVSQIDRRRGDDLSLSSAIRIAVLSYYQSGRAA